MRKLKQIEIIQEFLEQKVVTIRQLATVVGTLVALKTGNCIGSAFWRRLDIEKGLKHKTA